MTKITIAPDCGNAPKMQFLKEVNIAFAKADVDFLVNNVTDDIFWNIIGDEVIIGKARFSEKLDEMSQVITEELILDKTLSHGREGAVRGKMKIKGNKTYAFSDFYEFSSAKGNKIKSITSFVISIE